MPTPIAKYRCRWYGPIIALLMCLIAAPLFACQVPVFRYALDRWQADRYEIVILHDTPLGASGKQRLASLQASGHESPLAGNFEVRSTTVTGVKDPRLQDAWKNRRDTTQPLMVILYPRGTKDVPDRVASAVPFSDDNVAQIAESPVRREIVKRLLNGQSAIWVFVPSGHAEHDAAAMTILKEQVRENEVQLKLPVQDEIETEEELQQTSQLELQIKFSIVTLNRDDPREQFLLSSLLRSESDLLSLDQPMAFPVLGRGRVLYGLIGKGIAPSTIGAVSRFMVGPCSCQVKNQNPGFDLLLSCDWDGQLFGDRVSRPVKTQPVAPVLLSIPPGKSKR